jgi:hypothetical protein
MLDAAGKPSARRIVFAASGFRDLKFTADECFDSVRSAQAEAHELAFAFEIEVEIEERAAFLLGRNPLHQFSERNVVRAELKFVALWRFHDLLSHPDQVIG